MFSVLLSYYLIKFFIIKHISNHIIKNDWYFSFFYLDYILQYSRKYHPYLHEYSIKVLESFKCFKSVLSCLTASNGSLEYRWVLSISGWWLIRLNNKLVIPGPEPPDIDILYGWSGICGQFGLCLLCFEINRFFIVSLCCYI